MNKFANTILVITFAPFINATCLGENPFGATFFMKLSKGVLNNLSVPTSKLAPGFFRIFPTNLSPSLFKDATPLSQTIEPIDSSIKRSLASSHLPRL